MGEIKKKEKKSFVEACEPTEQKLTRCQNIINGLTSDIVLLLKKGTK